jgi:hypothetical protein
MKKVIFTLLLSSVMLTAFSQATYYWVGGINAAGGASAGWGTSSNWNTALNGSGTSRPSPSTGNTDILVFDGTNVGGSSATTGAVTVDVTSNEFGALRVINAANVTILRFGTTGTSSLTMNGEGTSALDFLINAGCQLTLSGGTSSLAVQFAPTATVTGEIYGTFTFTGGAHRFTAPANVSKAIIFKSGSTFNQGTGHSGNPFGSTAGTNAVMNDNIYFDAGSTYNYVAGSNPFALTAPASLVDFNLTSTFIVNSATVIQLSGRPYGNLVFNVSQTVTSNPTRLGSLTISSGVTVSNNSNSAIATYGNITVDGTLTFTGLPTFVMCGYTGTQTIGGTGTISSSSRILVASGSSVVLNKSLTFAPATSQTSSVFGTLNLGTATLTGNSFSSFSVRNSTGVNTTGDVTAGSNTLGAISSYTGVSVGMKVIGPGIPDNAVITSTSSPNLIISLPATASTTGATLNVSNTTGSILTSNTGGLNTGLISFNTISLGNTTSYTFNAATATPFPTTATASIGNLTANANITLNKNVSVSGIITLNNAKIIIPALDTLRLPWSSSTISGATSSSYIVTDVSGADIGVLKVDSFSTAKIFPVGTATNYLPVTLTPTSANDGFALSVFQGITTDGTPNGTAMTAAQKAKVVDAVWKISRVSLNADNCIISVNWPASLEGSSFAGYGNSIGIAKYNSAWDVVAGSGDNTANTATNTYNAFSSFAVGQSGFILPVSLSNLSAKEELGKIRIQWNVDAETNVQGYTVERSMDGTNFGAINPVNATGSKQYVAMDNAPSSTNYYRIKVMNKNGSFEYSNVVKIKLGNRNAEIAVFPNPVKGNKLSLQLNNLEKGNASIKLFNNLGQLLFTTSVNYDGGSQLQSIVLPATICKGMYRLVVTNNNTNLQQTIFVD